VFRYTLLVLAWIFLLVTNIFLWVNNGSPNIVALGILAALSVVPVVHWLKIGSLFEFKKKAGDEAANMQDRIVNIGHLNLELMSEEAARAFAKSLVPESKEELTEENKQLIEFIYNADQAIASILPLLRIWYVAIEVKVKNKPAIPKELAKVMDIDTLSLVKEVKVNAAKILTFKDSDKELKELLTPAERLIMLREAIDENTALPPAVEEAKKLVRDVYKATNFLAGAVSQAMAILLTQPHIKT
jgi:hypothetical protein